MNDILIYSIFIYVLLTTIIFITKPSFIYSKKNKKFKDFGFDNDLTCLPLPTLCCFISVLSIIISIIIVRNV